MQRTEFGVDLGGASSIDGLRALWRALLKSQLGGSEFAAADHCRERTQQRARHAVAAGRGPIERRGGGGENLRGFDGKRATCETSVFDGQRLALKGDDPVPAARPARKRSAAKRVSSEVPPAKPKNPTLSSTFAAH